MRSHYDFANMKGEENPYASRQKHGRSSCAQVQGSRWCGRPGPAQWGKIIDEES